MEWAHDHRSKISPLRDGIKMGVEMLSVRWNDMKGSTSEPSVAAGGALAEPSTSVPIAK